MLTATEALTNLLGCVREEYATTDDEGVRIVAQPGQTMTEDWCQGECAMVYVRVDSMAISTAQFPAPDAVPSGRLGPLAVRLDVGVARCVAVQDEQGNPPSEDQQTSEAVQFLDDARRLRRAIACCLTVPPLTTKNTLLGPWTPMGPFGGCAGGFWTLTVRAK